MKHYKQCTYVAICCLATSTCHYIGCACIVHTYVVFSVELNINPPVVDCDTVTIIFSSNGRTQCQLDHRYFTYCKSPYHQSGLRRGKHTVTIRTTDGLGGYKQKSVTFTIILGMYI